MKINRYNLSNTIKALIIAMLILLAPNIQPGIIVDVDNTSEVTESVEENTDSSAEGIGGILISDLLESFDEFGLYRFSFNDSVYDGTFGDWELILYPKQPLKNDYNGSLLEYLINKQYSCGGVTIMPHPLPPLKPEFQPNQTPLMLSDEVSCSNIKLGSSTVPEPSTLVLLGIGGLMISNRRRYS